MQQKLGAAILILALSLASARSAASDDILAFVRDRHIRTGQCRIQCVRQLAAAPRDSDCQRRRSCRGCWDLCPELATSVGRRNLESRCGSGDIGSGPACGYFFDDDDDQKRRESKEFPPALELSTSLVGCSLYWKIAGAADAGGNVHQLYGMDSRQTWFDMSQTMESFHALEPSQIDRVVKIRLVVISETEGTIAETEVEVNPDSCRKPDESDSDLPRPTHQGSIL